MGALAGDAMVLELQRRVPQLAASEALAALNRAIRWIHGQGSFQFELTTPSTVTITAAGGGALMATGPLPTDIDIGKTKLLANTNGTPIRKIAPQDVSEHTNYNTPAALTTRYHSYFIQSINSTSPPTHIVYVLPNATGSLLLTYHKLSVDIANNGASFSAMPRNFDDLLIDIAEANERLIFDIGTTWEVRLKQAQERALNLLDGYRTMTIQDGGLGESSVQIQQETQTGRA